MFIDLLGFGLILPLLPFYAESSGRMTGLLLASYSLMQFIGAPVLGRLSDRYGRRPILLISQLGTFVGFMILGFANALWMLFLSRIVDGISGANISTAQAYIADVSDEKNRAKNFGLIGAAFGLGFIIGPAVGGFLSRFGYHVPAFFAAGLSLLTITLTYSCCTEPERKSSARREFSVKALKRAFAHPTVGILLAMVFTFGLAFAMFQTSFALFASARFGFDVQQTALVLTYVGVLSVVMQLVVVKRVVKRLGENRSIVVTLSALALGLVLMAAVQSPLALIFVMPILSFGGGVTTPGPDEPDQPVGRSGRGRRDAGHFHLGGQHEPRRCADSGQCAAGIWQCAAVAGGRGHPPHPDRFGGATARSDAESAGERAAGVCDSND